MKLYGQPGSQVQRIYEALLTGPKSVSDMEKAGIPTYSLKGRMHDLRRLLQRDGCDILHRSGAIPTWELVQPQKKSVPLGLHRDENGQLMAFA